MYEVISNLFSTAETMSAVWFNSRVSNRFVWRATRAIFRLDALALSVIATATWLGGWVAVTLRYCIKTAKPIGKLYRPSESPITLVF